MAVTAAAAIGCYAHAILPGNLYQPFAAHAGHILPRRKECDGEFSHFVHLSCMRWIGFPACGGLEPGWLALSLQFF
jgi:hypothetical protein